MPSIVYKEDIIKELSKELNISEGELEEIVNLNIKYIKKSVLEKDYTLINLPNLCKLRFNYKLGLSSLSTLKVKETGGSKIKKESLVKKIKVLDDYKLNNKGWKTLMNFNAPLFERLWKKSKRIKYTKYIYNKMYTTIIELEEIVNEIISKMK